MHEQAPEENSASAAMPLPASPPPYTDEQMRSFGYTAWRFLPDGSVMAVASMLFGNGRLFMGVHQDGHEDAYCYDSLALASKAMHEFDPVIDAEPSGWKRHPYTGRRRPGGDASQEYVNP